MRNKKGRQFDFFMGLIMGLLIGILGNFYTDTVAQYLKIVSPEFYSGHETIINSFYGQTILLIALFSLMFYLAHRHYNSSS